MTTSTDGTNKVNTAEELRRSRKRRQKKLQQRSAQEPTSTECEPTDSTQQGESENSKKIQAKDITGLKYFDQLAPLLQRLHDDGCERDSTASGWVASGCGEASAGFFAITSA